MYTFDYIIVGSGLAGLYAAWKASYKGSVAVITKDFIRTSNSFNAQGGIAAVTAQDDDPEIHKSDTLIAGRGLCEEHSVDILVNEGPDRIEEIIAEVWPSTPRTEYLLWGLRVDITNAGFFMPEVILPVAGLRNSQFPRFRKETTSRSLRIQSCWICL
jgi:hypothetical protein